MIRKKEIYETPDGKRFDGEQEAERHCCDVLGSGLEEIISDQYPNYNRHTTQVRKLLLFIVENKDFAVAIADHIYRWVPAVEDNNENKA